MLVLILVLGPVLGSVAEAAEPDYAGQPLSEVLKDLQAAGLGIIYSSDLVKPEMVVASQPGASTPRAMLDEILAPFGLASQSGPGNTVLVVRAQPAMGRITGIVVDERTGLPLAGVRVLILASDEVAISDQAGRFQFSLAAGAYTLETVAEGFFTQRAAAVGVIAGRATTVYFALVPAVTFLKQVVVTPSHYSLLRGQPEPRQFLSRTEAGRMPHLGNDLYRAIGRLPGTARGDISARFAIRGGGPEEVLIVLDGLELVEPFHFDALISIFSTIDSDAVGGVDFMTGGFPVEYGDRMSGVIDIFSATPAATPQTRLGLNTITARYISDGTFAEGRGQWLAALRRGDLGLVLDWIAHQTDGDANNIQPTFYDFLGKFQYQLNDRTILLGNLLFAADDIRYSENDGPETVDTTNRIAYIWCNLKTAWTKRLFSQTVFSLGGVDSYRAGDLTETARVSDQRYHGFSGFKQDWNLELTDSHFVKWGLEARRVWADYDYESTGLDSDSDVDFLVPPSDGIHNIRATPSGLDLAAYVADRFRLVEPLVVELGLRFDNQSWVGDTQISPRVNLVYKHGRSTLRAAWGRFYQSQAIHKLQVEDGVTEFYPAQLAEHRLLGYQLALADGLTLRAEAYEKEMSDPRPRFENLFSSNNSHSELRQDRVLVAPTGATARGFELHLKKTRSEKFNWSLGYVLARVDDQIAGREVARSWDQRHAFSLSITYLGSKGGFLNFSGAYHTGWPVTRVNAEFGQAPDGSEMLIRSLGPRNGDRLSPYCRVDFRAGSTLPFGDGSFSYFVEIVNIFGRRNYNEVDGFGYLIRPNGGVSVSREGDTWIPLLPSIGITWQF